jgi:phosphoribosyl 1,2-cyclic phosphodiesterase
MSHGTYVAIGSPDLEGLLQLACDGQAIDLGAVQLNPFTVPHDAREPLQLTCTDGNRKLGVLTDLGHATPHVLEQLGGCHALFLECNHDTALLAQSSYPAFLKKRVGGLHGHLSNDAAAAIACSVNHVGLQHVVACHLSEQNNRPELARQAVAAAMNCHVDDIVVADAQRGSPWLSI